MSKNLHKQMKEEVEVLLKHINIASYNHRGDEEVLVEVDDLVKLKDYIRVLEGRVMGLEKLLDEKSKALNNIVSRAIKSYDKLR